MMGKFARLIAVSSLIQSPTLLGRAEGEGLPQFDSVTGYRIADYRAPVPVPPEGAVEVSVEQVQALRSERAIVIDAFPLRQYAITETGAWIYPEPHHSIPGAIWLPIVGWGEIGSEAQRYLDEAVSEATGDDPEKPLVVFCKIDCWLSWNLARRLARSGFHRVYWFSGGIDDWGNSGLPLVEVIPPPMKSARFPADLPRITGTISKR